MLLHACSAYYAPIAYACPFPRSGPLANRDRYDTEYLKILQSLVEKRVMRGMLQEDVAAAMGTNQSRVSRLESGEIRLDIIDYVRYCAAVDLDPGEPLKELFKSWRKI
jgi:hypothetical protein